MKNRNLAPDPAFNGYRILLEIGDAVLVESPEGKLVLIETGDDDTEAKVLDLVFIPGTKI